MATDDENTKTEMIQWVLNRRQLELRLVLDGVNRVLGYLEREDEFARQARVAEVASLAGQRKNRIQTLKEISSELVAETSKLTASISMLEDMGLDHGF